MEDILGTATIIIIFISGSIGALFGMIALGLCAASGRARLEEENMMLRDKYYKVKKKLHTLQHESLPYPIEGAD
jgi:hypothetical protein